ncbi:MAG: hypothetical protein IPM52_06355 [Bacteroidetes bacterium]|nr:hypothetical protein [Bacteroidota bacterium]
MESFTRPIKEITNEARAYLNLRVAQLSLSFSKAFARLNAMIVVAVVMLGLVSMVVMMLSFAFVFWYGSKVGTYYHGFLIAALFYVLVGLLVYVMRQKLFIDPVIRGMVRRLNEDLASDGLIPKVQNLQELQVQLELISLRIKQSEHQMETKFAELGESLNPANLARQLFGNLLSSSALAVSLLDLIIRLLRRRRS